MVRAAAAITGDEIVVIGSQAVLGGVPDAPEALLISNEADVYPRSNPSRAIEIDGAIGDGSLFHEQFGYYGHGVGPETAVAPAGWTDRLVRIEFPPVGPWKESAVAWFIDVHDLVLAKLAAGRSKDTAYAEEAIRSGLVDPENLRRRVDLMPESYRAVTGERLEQAVASALID